MVAKILHFLVHGRNFQIYANSNYQIVEILCTNTDLKSTKRKEKNQIFFINECNWQIIVSLYVRFSLEDLFQIQYVHSIPNQYYVKPYGKYIVSILYIIQKAFHVPKMQFLGHHLVLRKVLPLFFLLKYTG